MAPSADTEGLGEERPVSRVELSRCVDEYYMSVQTASNGVRILTLTILSP